MILSNQELFKALNDGRLVIKPEPTPRVPTIDQPHTPFDTHSVDLRLADAISVPKAGQFTYDLTQPGSIANTITQHSDELTITEGQPFHLKPNQFVLGNTLESIELPISPDSPTCLSARIEGKSSRARFGLLVHFTAPTVHPGFQGTLTLEIINLGPASLLLIPGMYIAQLIVEEVKGTPSRNDSEFQNQSSPAGNAASDGKTPG